MTDETPGARLASLISGEESPQRGTLEYLRSMSDWEAGAFIETAIEEDYYNDEPKLICWRTDLPPSKGIGDGGSVEPDATGGRDLSPRMGEIGALCEAVERVGLNFYRTADLWRGSPQEVRGLGMEPAVPTGWLASARMFDDSLHWTAGVSLPERSAAMIPAQSVFVPYRFHEGESEIQDPMTTGAAAGFAESGALRRGLLEVAERDALMLHHYAQTPAPSIDSASLRQPKTSYLIRYLYLHGLDVEFFDFGTDVACHVVVARVSTRDRSAPSFTFGSKASLDLEDALVGSLLEAVVFRRQLRDRWEAIVDERSQLGNNPEDIRSLMDRAIYWAVPTAEPNFSYMGVESSREVTMKPRYSVQEFSESFLEATSIFTADVTPRSFAKRGISVQKVVCPDMQKMHLSEPDASWSDRLLALRPAQDLNTIPHPFL